MQDNFNFFVGFDEETDDIIKSSSKYQGSKRYNNMIINGLASDNSEDLQGETLEPKGFEINEFLTGGLINLEHYTTRKGDSQYWIGEPIDAHVKGDEFFIKSKLWKARDLARNFWDTLIVMKESGSKRKAGYSIEGQKKGTDPNNKKRITKAKIKHCAVTFSPVNSNSWLDIAKGQQAADYIEPAYDVKEVNGQTYILQFEKDGKIITVNPDYSIDIKPKAMTTDSTRELIKESLKKKPLDIASWDTIMKAIKMGYIPKDKIPMIVKKVYNNLKMV